MYLRLNGEGQIRLLRLKTETGRAEIRCELTTFCLRNNLKYIAISYTSGAPINITKGTCRSARIVKRNGYEISVTQNLYDLLLRISQDAQLNLQWFWVDFLCINQDDDIEKGSQVSLMASIYRSADKVIAWLGEEDAHTEEAANLIETLATLTPDCLRQIRPKNMETQAVRSILGPLFKNRV
jgi:hypothetical protein